MTFLVGKNWGYTGMGDFRSFVGGTVSFLRGVSGGTIPERESLRVWWMWSVGVDLGEASKLVSRTSGDGLDL